MVRRESGEMWAVFKSSVDIVFGDPGDVGRPLRQLKLARL